jgi:opacity protein-like surface antigen
MRKLVGLMGLLALCVTPLLAQDTTTPPDDQTPAAPTAPTAPTEPVKVKRTYPMSKKEISVGYTHRSYYGPNNATIGLNGGYGSFDYNRYRWLAIEGELVGAVGSFHITGQPRDDLDVITLMGGVRINPLGHHRITPFGHALYGVGANLTAVPEFAGYPGNTSAVVVQSWEAGGGVDFSVNQRWAVRLIQFDYGVAKFLGNGVPNQSAHRFSFGVVYHLGRK